MSTPDSAPPPETPPGAAPDLGRIEQLFHEAREIPPEGRRAFLVQACGGDTALLREVESLLAQDDGPLLGGGVQMLARDITRGQREGSQLGPYVLGPLIGEGGMGEVYRARDARLDREVAIKLLPSDLANDPDRLRRLEREARVLASLNHPNIATLFGIEERDGVTGLVLELVPGPTLQQHLAARGALPLAEALAVARQIADALDAAHQHGIVHRDLKPANIKITPDGVVKVLDFGLARAEAIGPEGSGGGAGLTVAGRMLGTPAYMSPEQARGAATDRRTDIWAFGCVLFEMLTGERVFQGDSVADTIAAIIHRETPLDRLPPATPPHVRATIDRCLQKEARDRARDISDVRLALEGAFSGSTPAASAAPVKPVARWLTGAALAGALLSGALTWWFTASPPAAPPPMRFQVSPPEGLRFGRIALSPDGRSLAFTDAAEGRTGLWVHSFETGESRHLERAGQFTQAIFWSPDSRSIGFTSMGALSRIGIDGSPPQQIAPVEGFGGAQWLADGTILYGRARGGLVKIPAGGGTPVPVTELDAERNETGHVNPVMLPDGRRFLYRRLSANPQRTAVFVGSLDAAPAGQPVQPVFSLATETFLSQTADGRVHVLFVRDGALLAQDLDVASMTLSGPVSVVAERVGRGTGNALMVSVAGGTVAVRPPDAPVGGVPAWFERDGRRDGPVFQTPPPPLLFPQLSPDGTRLAAIAGGSIWVFPLDGRPPVRLTQGNSLSPIWTPDGQSIIYEQYGARSGLHVVAADGSSAAPRPFGPSGHYHALSFLPGGRDVLAAFELPDSRGLWSLVQIPWSGTAAPERLGDIVVPAPSLYAALSPDGRWLAYTTDTTGRVELWVRRFPTLDEPVRVSPNGAGETVWAKDGRDLFYVEGDKLMRVRVRPTAGARFEFEAPVLMTENSFVQAPQPPSFDVAADGRLLLLDRLPVPPAPIEVTVNWDRAVRRTLP